MALTRCLLISCLASPGSLASAQPTCVEGPQLDGDDNALLQLSSSDEPPPCLFKVCGEECWSRQHGKMGKCTHGKECDTSGKTDCTLGFGDHDFQRQQPMYCSLPPDYACYRQGWPSCCIGGRHCTTNKRPTCDLYEEDVRQAVPAQFDLVDIGSCQAPKKFIESKSQCQAAAKSLGYGEPVNDATLPSNPYGCYFKGNNPPGKKLWFNPNGGRNSQDRQRVSICEAGQSECENKTCGVACKKGVCSATGNCLELSRAPELGCEDNEDYRLVSIQDYIIDDSADTDDKWWDYADAFVEVLCSSTRYRSKVLKDQNRGHVGLNFFVQPGASNGCTLHLYDDDGGSHETILTGFIPLDQRHLDSQLQTKVRTCYFGGFCSTSIVAEVKYSIASSSRATDLLSSGAPLTPGVQSE